MPIELTSNLCDSIPVDVREVQPDAIAGKSVAQIAKTLVQYGNRAVEIGELFDVRGDGADNQIVWLGDLKHVHRIGHRLKRGQIMIKGSTGNHVGAEMTGGEIIIEGEVHDWAGAQMQGGLICVRGNAGDFVGGGYPGSKFGMNRGAILIEGDVGAEAGSSMRRGMIAIGGNAGHGLGSNMLAGTVVVQGRCCSALGLNMKRGTIVVAQSMEASQASLPNISFRFAGSYRPPIIPIIANWLRRNGFCFEKHEWVTQPFAQYVGDHLCGGRGELFLRA